MRTTMQKQGDDEHVEATDAGEDRGASSPAALSDEEKFADELLGNDNHHEVSFDLFESGNIWSQAASTHLQREAWRRGTNPRSDDDGRYGETANVFPRPETSTYEPLSRSFDAPLSTHPETSHPQQRNENEPLETAATATARAVSSDSWWRQGKTAPLLNQFDEERRVWYLAQAGVYDHEKNVHDAEGVPLSVDDDNDNDVVIVESAATSSSRTPNARRLHPMVGAVTPLPRNAGLQRAALTLAGNVNSPLAPAAMAAMQTPKRKTWQSTMAQKEEAKAAAAAAAASSTINSSAKKRRQSGGGRGGTPRTPIGRTNTPRGRGTGRTTTPRSAQRSLPVGGRRTSP